MKKISILMTVLVGALFALPTSAAAPDGSGPWADSVISSSQGLRKDGSAVLAARSNTSATLGIAETTGTPSDANTTESNFYSLGFGGTITLGFTNSIVNGPGADLRVYEVTGGTYPDEVAKVEASHNGTDWTVLTPNATRDEDLDLGDLPCAHYVKITDLSNPASFESTADAFDLDAVKALYSSDDVCESDVSITKSASSSEVIEGEEVTYTYTVTNTGNFPLDTVTVVDDKCASVEGPTGDVNNDNILSPAEVWTYTCTQNLYTTTTNTATVTAQDPFEDVVSDEASATVTVEAAGCTLTQGYWKNHSFGSKHFDDAWNMVTPDEDFYLSEKTWLEVLQTPPSGGNAYYQLAHQFIAAKLNIENGASVPANVQTALDDAEILFTLTPSEVGALKGSNSTRKQFIEFAGILGSYNEGLIGPGHCSENVLMTFTATDSLYYNGPTNAAPLYGTGPITFSWNSLSGAVTGGLYEEIVPPTIGTHYYNNVTSGTVSGSTVNLTFSRTNPNSYGPFIFTGTLVGNTLTGTLDGPYLFTANGTITP